jgi:radical SAM superfamily enzyme with C-terminal helix-hairpin-helix motif
LDREELRRGRMARVLIVDGFIDEPACLGVPPFLSPQLRAAAGAAQDAGAEVMYLTIDDLRRDPVPPAADISVVMAGSAVPGKYIRASPASGTEIRRLADSLPGVRILGGPAVLDDPLAGCYDMVARRDASALVFDLLRGERDSHRWRSLEEWNRWMILGAKVATRHPDFPQPLIAEIETYRGCFRYRSGGCSFCVEPLKGAVSAREPQDIIQEVEALRSLGVRNFRLGGQTCIISYKADPDSGDPPRPNPDAIEELFSDISSLGVGILHVDNANPAVIAEYPEESTAILRTLVRYCTSGNVLALGMESADPRVIEMNNLNATPQQVLRAIQIINEIGGERGSSGLPNLLP